MQFHELIWGLFTVSAEQEVSSVRAEVVLDGASKHPAVFAGRLDDSQRHLALISSTKVKEKNHKKQWQQLTTRGSPNTVTSHGLVTTRVMWS